MPEDAGETAAAAAAVVSDAAGVVGEDSPIAATGHEPAAASPEEFSEEPNCTSDGALAGAIWRRILYPALLTLRVTRSCIL